ncbi:thiamine-binding protein [Lapillicoccus sp.]|uniref:thiamine-binding protein n=1 Tax=Lapillicoccus sp. TaxID=1909287 RepID=UPI0025EC91B6|nr:thiamine-binding protein [Lapillicoccus sp.]
MRVRAEFTTEPFTGEGEPPEHVTHAAALLTEAGLDADLGPFGTMVEGEDRVLLPTLATVLAAAFASGATRFTLQVERVSEQGDHLDTPRPTPSTRPKNGPS